MMGTNNLDQKSNVARQVALMIVLLVFTSAPTVCVAAEFGFLVGNFYPQSDDLALAVQAEEDADDEDAEDDELDLGQQDGGENAESDLIPEVVAGRFRFPPLSARTIDTSQIGNGRTPDSFRSEQTPNQVPLPESAGERGMHWNWSIAQWTAANTFSYPLYFEDRMLERHGHDRWGHLQPAAAGARFFSTIPMLPYLMTVNRPCDCEYKLGHYRAGSCAPVMIQRPPLERKAVVAEAIGLGGGLAIFP